MDDSQRTIPLHPISFAISETGIHTPRLAYLSTYPELLAMQLGQVALVVCLVSINFTASPLLAASDNDITWLVEFDGESLPDAKLWKSQGTPKTDLTATGLKLSDDSRTDTGSFRATWKPQPDRELIVEARVKVIATTGSTKPEGTSVWPWRDGSPACVHVSDGRRQEGLALATNRAMTFGDRVALLDTTNDFHVYRLVFRGNDVAMEIDGKSTIAGQGAFARPADSGEAFIQFGSTAKSATGSAEWSYVKLGTRKLTTPPSTDPLKVTISEPWQITRDDGVKQTRPYLYDMGNGLLLMSVAQGPDALYEPYGVLKSTNAGETWKPIPGLDQTEFAPLPMIRLKDGTILGASRWVRKTDDGRFVGKTIRMDAKAEKFTMIDNETVGLPKEYTPEGKGDVIVFERSIFNDDDGGVTVVIWTRITARRADGSKATGRTAHLLRSTDGGETWRHHAVVGDGGEPAVARMTGSEQTAMMRVGPFTPLNQSFSHDGGKTWGEERRLEVGSVDPDLCWMSDSIPACSFGRPISSLMFSLDRGRTWSSHHMVSDRAGFNYTSIREISPGRLLYVHDAPNLRAVYVDVARQ
jgi:photosystem II stability/assembly factor-like uncharacterized protein